MQNLHNVITYCLQFTYNVRSEDKIVCPLSDSEIHASHLMLLKLTQLSAFSNEIHSLSKEENISQKSTLLSLNPFLNKGNISIGGRLKNARISENQKHPIILRRNHHETQLTIHEELSGLCSAVWL